MILKKILIVNLISTVALLASACGEQAEQVLEKPLRPVRTLVVEVADGPTLKEFPAVVEAALRADLSFRISGRIVSLPVKQGDRVQKGQELARLDDAELRIQLADTQSSFDKAEADFNRASQLIQKNTISRADFDQVKANFNTARAHLDSARNNLSYARLKAPFSGGIARTFVENFQEVNAREPVLVLHDLSSINLKIDVPESVIAGSEKGRRPNNMVARFDAYPDERFPLQFKEVATQPDEVSKTYEVILTMQTPRNRNLLPGMTARVYGRQLLPENARTQIILPASVVLQDSQGNYVFKVSDNGDGTGTIQRQAVTIGDIVPRGIEIFSGIGAGDQVVTAGMSKIKAGMQVRI